MANTSPRPLGHPALRLGGTPLRVSATIVITESVIPASDCPQGTIVLVPLLISVLSLFGLGQKRRRTSAASAATAWEHQVVEKLSRAIEQTADGVLITDRNGVIEYVNPAFEQITGFTRAEAIGSTPRILRSGLQTQSFYERLWATILSGQAYRAVLTNRRRDGRLYDEELTITPIRDGHGAITHFVSTARDITQRKRTQEAVQRLNMQLEREASRLAGVLHDEAGQFLTSAHLSLAALASDVPAGLHDRIDEVRAHLTHVEERLRQISHEIHPRVVTDLGLVEAVRFLVENFSHRTGVGVSLQSSLNRRYRQGIETVLYRLVQEALTNVAKHAQATTAVVTLTEDDAFVICSIRDNGIGVEHWAISADARGGLGLRLMRDRVEAVGGTLTVSSTSGSGTELRAQIPAEV